MSAPGRPPDDERRALGPPSAENVVPTPPDTEADTRPQRHPHSTATGRNLGRYAHAWRHGFDNLGEAALHIASIGLPVLGLLPHKKRPRLDGGYKSATLDTAAIAEHWRRYPHDNLGIRPRPGDIVIDVDPRNGGDRELQRMIRLRGSIPETWTARTGSDGLHYWFTVGELDEIRGHLCGGVDIKHGGTGFVVAPPSIHPNGQRYQWFIPPHGQPAPAPLWLKLAIQPVARFQPHRTGYTINDNLTGSGEYTLQCLIARINAAPEGQRNRTVYGALKDALRQGDLDDFEPDLIGAALTPGLNDSEVAAIVKSVRKRGAA